MTTHLMTSHAALGFNTSIRSRWKTWMGTYCQGSALPSLLLLVLLPLVFFYESQVERHWSSECVSVALSDLSSSVLQAVPLQVISRSLMMSQKRNIFNFFLIGLHLTPAQLGQCLIFSGSASGRYCSSLSRLLIIICLKGARIIISSCPLSSTKSA